MSIADMVEQMIERGIDRDMIVLAVRTAEISTGNPVESRLAKIRAADRERKRIKKLSAGNPSEIPADHETALTLPSSQQVQPSKEVKKVRARKTPKHPLPPDFEPKDSHFAAAERLKVSREAVFEKTEDMRIWAASSGEWKSDWDATLHGFLRRDADKLRKSNGQGSVLAAADRLIERIKQFDAPAPGEPDRLRGGTGAVAVRSIPEGGCERPGDLRGNGRGDPVGLSAGNDAVRDGPEDWHCGEPAGRS